MKELVRKCCSNWRDGQCRLSAALEGWGCRLLTCMPESIPHTEREKARLFSRVYRHAEDMGVLECQHYDEHTIDRTLGNEAELRRMVDFGCPTQAELLSDFYLQK